MIKINLEGLVGQSQLIVKESTAQRCERKITHRSIPRTIGPKPHNVVMARFPPLLHGPELGIKKSTHPKTWKRFTEELVCVEVFDPQFERPAEDFLFPMILKHLR